jgi:hypothetical protein
MSGVTVAFVCCIESGNLENQVRLLARSIRRWTGSLAQSEIYCVQPRRGPDLRRETLKELDQLEVRFSNEPLNSTFSEYKFVNKIVTCAAIEERASEDVLVWVDSDTVFIGEPSELELAPTVAAAVRPADYVKHGSTGPGHKRDQMWTTLYQVCGVPEPPFVETTIGQHRVRAYWQGGLVAVRREEGIFRNWERDHLTAVSARVETPPSDQIFLPIALARVAERLKILSPTYNYPLPRRPQLPPSLRSFQLSELRHLHYHRWFNRPNFLAELRPKLDRTSEIYRWLKQFLPFEPTHMEDLPAHHPRPLRKPPGLCGQAEHQAEAIG